MLKGRLIHPEILSALASAGHGAQVLIADGNYPFTTRAAPRARIAFLNLSPGVVSGEQVLRAIAAAIPIEAAAMMGPPGPDAHSVLAPPILRRYEACLTELCQTPPPIQLLSRFEFYDAAQRADVALVIATAEIETYANLLLTIGVQ